MRFNPLSVVLLVLVSSLAAAQLCGSNGGNASLRSSPLALGSIVTVDFSGLPGTPAALFVSDAPATVPLSPIGVVCLDLASPTFFALFNGAMPASGTQSFVIPIPNIPALLTTPAFLQGIANDPGHPSGVALTAGLRADFENPDSYFSVPSFASNRALATVTRMGDGRVLFAGGGDGSLLSASGTMDASIYDPFDRSMTAAPDMAETRVWHTATALSDGRVLVVGGVTDNLNRTATAGGEIFDPATGSWTPITPMSKARVGHSAELLADGRVLVCGGTALFFGNGNPFSSILGGSFDDAEVYDPFGDTWTPVSNNMATRRVLPTSTRLDDGRILVASGFNGSLGSLAPTWTPTVDFYDPNTNSFSPGPSIGAASARAGASAVRLDNGEVVVAGGLVSVFFVPTATDTVRVFSNGAWSSGPSLPTAVSQPGFTKLSDGSVLVAGGVTGDILSPPSATDTVVRIQGGSILSVALLPNGARGAAAAIALDDGGVVIAGGIDNTPAAVADAVVLTPDL